MAQLRDKILQKLYKKKSQKGDFIITLHDSLMAEYGWIPLEEFKKLPMQTVMNLMDEAHERHKREEKQSRGKTKGGMSPKGIKKK
jgi:hypothetical protein